MTYLLNKNNTRIIKEYDKDSYCIFYSLSSYSLFPLSSESEVILEVICHIFG